MCRPPGHHNLTHAQSEFVTASHLLPFTNDMPMHCLSRQRKPPHMHSLHTQTEVACFLYVQPDCCVSVHVHVHDDFLLYNFLDLSSDRLVTTLAYQFCVQCTGVEQQQQSELASAAQQNEARLSEVESELSSRVKALSHLLDHTAKAGSQVMSHVAQLEATTKSDIAGRFITN